MSATFLDHLSKVVTFRVAKDVTDNVSVSDIFKDVKLQQLHKNEQTPYGTKAPPFTINQISGFFRKSGRIHHVSNIQSGQGCQHLSKVATFRVAKDVSNIQSGQGCQQHSEWLRMSATFRVANGTINDYQLITRGGG
jgi:hypothetical protein